MDQTVLVTSLPATNKTGGNAGEGRLTVPEEQVADPASVRLQPATMVADAGSTVRTG